MPRKKTVKKKTPKRKKRVKKNVGILGRPFTPIRAMINLKIRMIETYEELQEIVGECVDE